MPAINDITPGQRISFTLFPNAQFGDNFSNVVFVGQNTHRAYTARGFDLQAFHIRAAPSVAGIPADFTQYNWFEVEMPNGTSQVLGVPWVDESTIVIVESGLLTLTFNSTSATTRAAIIAALAANGHTPDRVTHVTT